MIPLTLKKHLETGTTTLCHAWTVIRRDGLSLGFTDHDRDLEIDGLIHRAGSGLTARALQQSTGLAVDNSEAVGSLSDASVSEEDLMSGRYDGAEIRIWLVNWSDVDQRAELFRGTFGEMTRLGAEFRVELRGLSEALGQPVGLAYTRGCSAVLGDSLCRFNTLQPGYFVELAVETIDAERRILGFGSFGGFDPRWFEFGRVEILGGAAVGLTAVVKADRINGAGRVIELWQSIRAEILAGDPVRLTVGCDKRAATCRLKFANLVNFRGFPHIPGEDWLASYPRSGQSTGGGSLFLAPGSA